MISEKESNKEKSAKKLSIMKWKWFTQDPTAWGIQGGGPHKREASLPLALTWALHVKLPDFIATWTMTYEEPSVTKKELLGL